MHRRNVYDAAVIGAGPAGLASALAASDRGLSVALIDAHRQPGAKLSLAGGGMGNFTNKVMDKRHYDGSDISDIASVLRRYGCQNVLALLSRLKLPFEERDLGQIFGLRPARFFAERLALLCDRNGVDFYLGRQASGIMRLQGAVDGPRFKLDAGNESIFARQLVLATGSPACPQSGASGQMLRLAEAWGHATVPFRPVLTPFRMQQDWELDGLSGISLNVRLGLKRGETIFHPDPEGVRSLLFTHRGLSGPAALTLSCWWQKGDLLVIDFLPELRLLELLDDADSRKLLVRTLLSRHLPSRLAERLCPPELAVRKCAEIKKQDRNLLARAVHSFQAAPSGTEGFAKAEAAAGGVRLSSLTKGLESSIVPGLFFCGELLDATGILGGYNIHWALASGNLVGLSLQAQ
ncbi:MAG: aminoacetone oxidase family FAD-binding enzyme [Mailhella sp.]|nr:aminoacetone oxidase family FAD-binding enzyme [Mailhella sp.]